MKHFSRHCNEVNSKTVPCYLLKTRDCPVPKTLTETKVREILEKHDVNNDGVLCWEELKAAFKELGAWIPSFRANRGLHYADANKDGVINEDEKNDLVNYIYNLGYKVKS
ncbi:hypothetical protein Pint_07157 [Pistacia integerrima]|uniref:Uncharacterized protein n=2 Tax=Pistacia TaxID=55512 RepID=A0ACC1AGD8_9ROSI|nr:hypothetical protein Pint_07157 [Pistacia integerrima]KAJ0085506.1 hypothetical protein Patl1_07283 [Pistacia atlantica]